ncbi:protein phosphatase 1D-like [Clytia hemisphaerica]|uniref:PPM-type phosphatase domain-containing protein n=1 Tax=Clytia hemisphaerica TaxID=252671 RepID=A0A7M5XJX7_9CNID
MQKGILPLEALRICHDKNPGMRKYMEDEISIVHAPNDQIPTTYLGVFDGHGGKEAAIYARDNLFKNLKLQPGFFDNEPSKVKEAIREGFIKTHMDMFQIVDTWPKRKDGHLSTSGTTATVVILRQNKVYVAHVGDSAAVIAQKKNNRYVAQELTVDHKPESVKEKTRIEQMGGRVAATNGVPRVIWKRAVKLNHSTTPRYEYVPFLAVSRSLGDLWSYDESLDKFVVSPDPDVDHIDLEDTSNKNKFIILASDGLWGVMNAKEAVDNVCQYELNVTRKKRNCSKFLVDESLSIWQRKRARADNISAIVVFLDDEFLPKVEEDNDSVSIASSEADTVIIAHGDDDTPPMMSNCSANLNSLVRQIALPSFSNKEEENKKKSKVVSPSTSSGLSSCGEDSEGKEEDVNQHNKRKLLHSEESSSQCKRARTSCMSPSPLNNESEDSHQCNSMITVLSAESLVHLQLDQDLGFVDEETNSSSQNINKNFQPVPQAAK